jgi:putative transposase
VDSGQKAVHVCRELGVTETTFYRLKKQYAGMGISELRKLKALVADLSLDKHILQEVISKKV